MAQMRVKPRVTFLKITCFVVTRVVSEMFWLETTVANMFFSREKLYVW